MPRRSASSSSLYPIVQDLTQEEYGGDCCCPTKLWTAAKPDKLSRARNDKALLDACDSLTQSTNGVSASFDESYVLTRQIFRNSTSQVWECVHRTSGQRYCVKMIEARRSDDWREVSLLKVAQPHPNIVKLVEVLDEHVVMEFLTGGNLLSRVVQARGLPEVTVKGIAKSMLAGVLHLHDNGICHNDLQPANVLLDGSDTAKLSDFGNATRVDSISVYALQQPSRSNVSYAAPEVLLGGQATAASDMWSVGVVLFFCLFGRPPFNDQSTGRPVVSRIHRAEYYFPAEFKDEDVSRASKQFISNLLHPDPSVRLTAEEALKHPWIFTPRRSSSSSLTSFRAALPTPTPLLCTKKKSPRTATTFPSVRSLARKLMCRPFRRRTSQPPFRSLQSNSTDMSSLLAS